ncbi:apolipoprotein N-acyltransferase [Schaalia sp. Marseille-Q2122]|uniref:apolipoprotein N-acyltransferase n=1 Tax=Schaalia sp. Marseille-Q2122 TaxID=2736604 RepID=UPI00158A67F4|nr:apolipoprotein N-acyltransferase [Schaalia sp. Marseille-Q2122]
MSRHPQGPRKAPRGKDDQRGSRVGVSRFLWNSGRSIAAGALMWAAFPDVGAWYASIISLALIIAVVDHSRAWGAIFYAGLFGSVFWLPHVHWATIASGGWLPWVMLALTQILWWMLWGLCVRIFQVWPWARTLRGSIAFNIVAWTGIETLRSATPFTGFPWGKIAYPQVDSPLGHLAPWGGEVLVASAVVAAAVLVRWAFALVPDFEGGRWYSRPAMLVGLVGILVLPALVPLYAEQQAGAVKVGIVQGNVEIPGAKTYAIEGKVTGNHVAVTEELLEATPDVEVIFWGEGALDRDPRVNALNERLVTDIVDKAQRPILVGFNEYDGQKEVIRNLYGPWYPATAPTPGLGSLYGKQLPVPFGEYIPFREFISSLATEAAQVRVDMEAVENSSRLDVMVGEGRSLPVATGICFEVAYEGLLAEGVRSGGQIIVIPSNNYHFRTSPESAQQAQMARFRAMEFSRSAMQVSTTGESVLIRPDGGVLARTGRQSGEFAVGTLPLRTSLTPAAWMGYWSGYVMVGGLAVGIIMSGIVGVVRRYRSGERNVRLKAE